MALTKARKKVARDGGDHIELLIAESIEDQKFVELSFAQQENLTLVWL